MTQRPDPRGADDPLLAWVDRDELPRTPVHPCPYLPGLQARERAFLADSLDAERYHDLMDRGFRRTGDLFYATDCPGCRRCVPLRVPVATFEPSRSQRRTLRKNADVHVTVRAPAFTRQVFELYRRYLAHQHPGGPGDETIESFRESLYADVVDSVEVLYTVDEQLVAVSLLDVCSRSVSAVYHFYEPDFARRSLGVFSVLTEIAWTARIGVPHYYLGYWIEGAATMQYKASYGPHELLRDGRWQPA
jgi:arginine-tRNA-protein transferase